MTEKEKQPLFTIERVSTRFWDVMQGDYKVARIYSHKKDDAEAKQELEALAARFLDMPSLLKNVRMTVSLELVDYRLKAMYHLIRFACWIGGVGGVDLVNDENKKISEINVKEEA